MNIAVVGPYFANAKHGAEVGIVAALKELGHNVSAWDYRVGAYLSSEGLKLQTKDEGLLLEVIKNDSVDIVLAPGPGLPEEVFASQIWKKYSSCLKIIWSSEPIRLAQYREKMYKQKKKFDLFFTFDESEIPIYKGLGISAAWLPQAYCKSLYHPLPVTANQRFAGYFVFIGSVGGKWENRVHFLKRVRDMGYKVNSTTIFDADRVNKAYNMHEAVLNLGLYVPDESGPVEDLKAFGLQQRVFEAIGSGKVCITNQIDGNTNKLFEHGKNVLFYNKDNLGEILELALNKKETSRMEEEIDKIREQHDYTARMEKLLRMVDW